MERKSNAGSGPKVKVVWKRKISLGFDYVALYAFPHVQQMELVGTLITNVHTLPVPELSYSFLPSRRNQQIIYMYFCHENSCEAFLVL